MVTVRLGPKAAYWLLVAAETFEDDTDWPQRAADRRAFRNAIIKLRAALAKGLTQ